MDNCIDFLKEKNIVDIELSKDRLLIEIIDAREYHSEVKLSKIEISKLIDELSDLRDQMIDPSELVDKNATVRIGLPKEAVKFNSQKDESAYTLIDAAKRDMSRGIDVRSSNGLFQPALLASLGIEWPDQLTPNHSITESGKTTLYNKYDKVVK